MRPLWHTVGGDCGADWANAEREVWRTSVRWGRALVSCGAMVLLLPQRTRFPLPVHLVAERWTWVEAESLSVALRVEQMSVGVGLTSAHMYADMSTTTLGHGRDTALAAYDVAGWGAALAWTLGALAGWAGEVGVFLRSFRTLVVALVRLVSVFSRLVRQIWRAVSS
jgi:hypothetical protein